MKNILFGSAWFVFAAIFGGCIEEIERREFGEPIGSPEAEAEGDPGSEIAVPEPGGDDPLVGPVDGPKTVIVTIYSSKAAIGASVFIDKANRGEITNFAEATEELPGRWTGEIAVGEHEIKIWGEAGYIQADNWYECLDEICWEGEYHDLTLFTITPETTELFIPLYRDLTGTWIDQNGVIYEGMEMVFEDPQSDETQSCPTTWARTTLGFCVEHDDTLSLCKNRVKDCIEAVGVVIEDGMIFTDGSKLKVEITFLWQGEGGQETPQTVVYERWEN